MNNLISLIEYILSIKFRLKLFLTLFNFDKKLTIKTNQNLDSFTTVNTFELLQLHMHTFSPIIKYLFYAQSNNL